MIFSTAPYTGTSAAYLLHETAQAWQGGGVGWFSLKWFPSGAARYHIGRWRHSVQPKTYLLLNEGTAYELEITIPTESCCLFWPRQNIQQTEWSLRSSHEKLLDDPYGNTQTSEWIERTYQLTAQIEPLLERLKQPQTPLTLAEHMESILEAILHEQGLIQREIEHLSAVRASTRAELYQRMWRVRDYMHAYWNQQLALATLAEVAGLSPNHLLRSFRMVHHCTPHQYLVRLRLEHAQRLLRTTELSITEICYDIGFHSLGSFSSLFRQRHGCSPTDYRNE